ncbi:MAG: hypothetical protein HQL62_08590 [Magnetococcales bacterium]|nr:hypothetical protein [Magnetococcales bacterium]
MYADSAAEVLKRRKEFLAKWKLKCRGVAESLEEAGERLFTLETATMFFWALMASGQIIMRRVEGWKTLQEPPINLDLDQAA